MERKDKFEANGDMIRFLFQKEPHKKVRFLRVRRVLGRLVYWLSFIAMLASEIPPLSWYMRITEKARVWAEWKGRKTKVLVGMGMLCADILCWVGLYHGVMYLVA
jgi:hypothetical protein